MPSFIYQTKMNFVRIVLRNKKFFIFDLALPVIFYLLYTKILSSGMPANQMAAWKVDYLVSMMVFSCLLGSIITVSNTLLEDHTSEFDLLVDISPLPKIHYYASLVVVFLTLNLISVVTLSLVGIYVNNVNLPIAKLILVVISSLLGTLPLIIIGILISKFKNPSTINLLNGMAFPVAMISGLWWPLSTLPSWLQTVGKMLPTYAISEINKSIIQNQTIQLSNIFNLVSWLFILIIITLATTKLPQHGELQSE
ncbi:ABC transporter permease [Companilactobacillus sp.]|uniref:ABC transporter permease n=1 Tax=Companilactobacillus sp. TaxID=2767905 RepID=UPI00261F9E29|nr:ABC transporter permease [Companilactobacillus sp.]